MENKEPKYTDLFNECERLRLENSKLKAFHLLFEKAWDSDTFGMLYISPDGKILEWNRFSEKILRIDKSFVKNGSFFDFFEEAKSTIQQHLIHALSVSNELNKHEYLLKTIPGNHQHVIVSYEVAPYGKDFNNLLVTIRQTGFHPGFYESIKQKDYFLNEAQRIAKLGYYFLDVEKGTWTSSEVLDEIFGIDKNFVRNIDNWGILVHEDERHRMMEYLTHEVLEKEQPFDRIYKIVHQKTLQERWVHGKGVFQFNQNGNVVSMIGTIQDITEQKLYENALYESQKLYHDLVETSQDLIWQCNTSGEFTFLNHAWEIKTGYGLGEMIGKSFSAFLDPPGVNRFQNEFNQILKCHCETKGFETICLTKTGEPVHLIINANVAFDKLNQVTGIRGMAFDVTDLRKSQQLVQQKSEELDKFFSAALDLLCVADIDGHFIRINPLWVEILGHSEEELLSHKFLDFVHPDDYQSTIDAIFQLSQQKDVLNFVNRYRCKDGSYRHLEWRSSPADKYIYAAARDITSRIESEENLKRINKELKEISAQKDKFISIIAHDIRNPLNTLLGFTELLSRNYKDYSEAECVQMISLLHESTRQLYQLIENLLEWSLTKTGRIQPQIEPVDLFQIVEDVFSQTIPSATQKNISLVCGVVQGIRVMGDKDMLKTILRNLISNAVKFSFPNKSVEVGVSKTEHLVIIMVKDHGIGIHPDMIEKLFIPEESYSTTGKAGEKGSGMGLPLCKELVEIQNGKIWVTSEPGKGSTFLIQLPGAP